MLARKYGHVVSTTAHNSQEQLMNGFAYLSVPSSSAAFAPIDRVPCEASASLPQRLRTALLDEIALGLIVCDRHGQLQFANPAAPPG